jgi:hypothetical protein
MIGERACDCFHQERAHVRFVHLLADASFDLSNAAKHLFLDAKLSLARHTLADLCRIDADARRTAHQTNLEPSMKT